MDKIQTLCYWILFVLLDITKKLVDFKGIYINNIYFVKIDSKNTLSTYNITCLLARLNEFVSLKFRCYRDLLWTTNSSNHRKDWTANLLHTMLLLNPLNVWVSIHSFFWKHFFSSFFQLCKLKAMVLLKMNPTGLRK